MKLQKDLFETPDLIPAHVMAVLDKNSERLENGSYDDLNACLNDLQKVGYTFEYYLYAVPYALRPVDIPLEQIEGFEN